MTDKQQNLLTATLTLLDFWINRQSSALEAHMLREVRKALVEYFETSTNA